MKAHEQKPSATMHVCQLISPCQHTPHGDRGQWSGRWVCHLPDGPSSRPTSRACAISARISLPHAAGAVEDSTWRLDLMQTCRTDEQSHPCERKTPSSKARTAGVCMWIGAIFGDAGGSFDLDTQVSGDIHLLRSASLAASCALRVSSRACHAASSPSAKDSLSFSTAGSPLVLECEALAGSKSIWPWRSASQFRRMFSTFLIQAQMPSWRWTMPYVMVHK